MRESRRGARGRLLRRRAGRGRRRRRPRHGLHRLPVLRVGPPRLRPAPCSRRRTTRRSTTASSSACPGARPIGRDTGLADIEAGAEELLGEPLPPLTGTWREQNLLDEWADHVVSFVDVGLAAPAQGRGRHGQRHGRAGRADRVRAAALLGRDPLPRARRQLPEPPGRPDPAREPGRPEGGRPRAGRRHRAGLRRRRRPRLPGRREGRARVGLADHGAGGRVHADQAPGRDDPLQPHLLPRGARGRDGDGRHAPCAPRWATPSSRR